MSDADEPLPPGADEEEEAPPGTEQHAEAGDVATAAAIKPEDAAQPAAQPGAEYAGYYGQDAQFYGQQYAYPGYYGQGYPDAAAGEPFLWKLKTLLTSPCAKPLVLLCSLIVRTLVAPKV